MKDEGWVMEYGSKFMVVDGGWMMENGGWNMEDGGCTTYVDALWRMMEEGTLMMGDV
jgi:hypothetical protein